MANLRGAVLDIYDRGPFLGEALQFLRRAQAINLDNVSFRAFDAAQRRAGGDAAHRLGEIVHRGPGVGARHQELEPASVASSSSARCRSRLRAAAPGGKAAGSRSSGTSRASTARASGPVSASPAQASDWSVTAARPASRASAATGLRPRPSSQTRCARPASGARGAPPAARQPARRAPAPPRPAGRRKARSPPRQRRQRRQHAAADRERQVEAVEGVRGGSSATQPPSLGIDEHRRARSRRRRRGRAAGRPPAPSRPVRARPLRTKPSAMAWPSVGERQAEVR